MFALHESKLKIRAEVLVLASTSASCGMRASIAAYMQLESWAAKAAGAITNSSLLTALSCRHVTEPDMAYNGNAFVDAPSTAHSNDVSSARMLATTYDGEAAAMAASPACCPSKIIFATEPRTKRTCDVELA